MEVENHPSRWACVRKNGRATTRRMRRSTKADCDDDDGGNDVVAV